jgi:hypothetical protein
MTGPAGPDGPVQLVVRDAGITRHGSATTTAPAGRPDPNSAAGRDWPCGRCCHGWSARQSLSKNSAPTQAPKAAATPRHRGKLPVPVRRTVTDTGGVDGPPVERGRHQDRGVPVCRTRAALACE